MGRPVKQGIDNFPLDVGFFTDIKIRKISQSCGSQSASILICLLCNIYRNNGYYILWNEDTPYIIAQESGTTFEAVNEVVNKAIQVGFFNAELYQAYKILTSAGIQKRYMLATYQRKERQIINEYIICNGKSSTPVMMTPKVVNEDKKNNQSKKKEKAVKEDKEKKPTGKDIEQRKKDFYEELKPYLGKYPKEMLRRFYDYWSEMNKSGTKMRFELQKTWELSKRLVTWASRDNNFGSSSDVGTILRDNSVEKYENEDKWNR